MVTAMEGYDDSLVPLVDETMKNIKTYLKDEAARHAADVSISFKVALTIAYASLSPPSRSPSNASSFSRLGEKSETKPNKHLGRS